MQYPWAGGMNNPQFSSTDLNLDGIKDLVIYDRAGKSFTTYLNVGTPDSIGYVYAPEYISNFDSCDCLHWVFLVDYTCDGKEDIICSRPFSNGPHFRVYEQVIYNGDSIGFELRIDQLMADQMDPRPAFNLPTDLPAIADMDYDGDIDIVSSQTGFNQFVYYRNYAMETLGRCDTLVMERETGCWGHFTEGAFDNSIKVADTMNCPRTSGGDPLRGGGSRHAGSTLLVTDLTGDSLVEVLLGDISFTNIVVAFNGGIKESAFMDSVTYDYPDQDSSVDIDLFPAVYYQDVNNDGVRDLMAAPHERFGTEDINATMLYINQGQDNLVDFKFQERGFIAKDHIDAGRGSVPVFLDYNADGLMDMAVGSLTRYRRSFNDTVKFRYLIDLYENIGTATEPAFQLVDEDFLGLSSASPAIEYASLAPGDLDNDGDTDLIVGNSLGTLLRYENVALPGMAANYVQITDELQDGFGNKIDVGAWSSPDLYDFDDDGDLDLFVGEEFGFINFYENTGNSTSPIFTRITEEWGFIDVNDEFDFFFSGASRPRFIDYDSDGVTELLLGSEPGHVFIYEDLTNPLGDTLQASGTLLGFDFGMFAAPAAAHLDTSGYPVIVVGNARGGLMLVQSPFAPDTTNDTTMTIANELEETPPIRMFPNPTTGFLTFDLSGIETLSQSPATIRLFNPMGQLLLTRATRQERFQLDLSSFSNGLYTVMVQTPKGIWQDKVILND